MIDFSGLRGVQKFHYIPNCAEYGFYSKILRQDFKIEKILSKFCNKSLLSIYTIILKIYRKKIYGRRWLFFKPIKKNVYMIISYCVAHNIALTFVGGGYVIVGIIIIPQCDGDDLYFLL